MANNNSNNPNSTQKSGNPNHHAPRSDPHPQTLHHTHNIADGTCGRPNNGHTGNSNSSSNSDDVDYTDDNGNPDDCSGDVPNNTIHTDNN